MTSVLNCSIVAYRCYKSIINLTFVKVARALLRRVRRPRYTKLLLVTLRKPLERAGQGASRTICGSPGWDRSGGLVHARLAASGPRHPLLSGRAALATAVGEREGMAGEARVVGAVAKRARLLIRGSGSVPLARAALSRERRRPLDVDPMLTPESKPPVPFSRGPAVICFRINNLL